jgi:hypothetical protein
MQNPFMKYESIFKKIVKDGNNIQQTKLTIRKHQHNIKNPEHANYQNRPTIININKSDTRKRFIDESNVINKINKSNLSSMSHLQLMQDVVALIDDLITKVCDNVSFKQPEKEGQNFKSIPLNNDDINSIIIKSEINPMFQIFMNDSVKEEIQLSQEKNIVIIDETDKNKSHGKWFQTENLQTVSK